MARLARVIAVGTPHHVTQRGNARRYILHTDEDRLVYRQLLRANAERYQLSIVGYCLMSNHVHLIVIPRRPDSIALALKYSHGRYATYLNAREQSSGHVWQGRYYSCPLDRPHLWAALRYTERNPVRAGITMAPPDYGWSSAALHCGEPDIAAMVEMGTWGEEWTSSEWRAYLGQEGSGQESDAIRRATHTGRPLGTPDFVADLERQLGRRLAPEKGGRPPTPPPDGGQESFAFEAPRCG